MERDPVEPQYSHRSAPTLLGRHGGHEVVSASAQRRSRNQQGQARSCQKRDHASTQRAGDRVQGQVHRRAGTHESRRLGRRSERSKVEGLLRFKAMGRRVFAFVDNEPSNLLAVSRADHDRDVLLLHANTIFQSKVARFPHPSVKGSVYYLPSWRRRSVCHGTSNSSGTGSTTRLTCASSSPPTCSGVRSTLEPAESQAGWSPALI